MTVQTYSYYITLQRWNVTEMILTALLVALSEHLFSNPSYVSHKYWCSAGIGALGASCAAAGLAFEAWRNG